MARSVTMFSIAATAGAVSVATISPTAASAISLRIRLNAMRVAAIFAPAISADRPAVTGANASVIPTVAQRSASSPTAAILRATMMSATRSSAPATSRAACPRSLCLPWTLDQWLSSAVSDSLCPVEISLCTCRYAACASSSASSANSRSASAISRYASSSTFGQPTPTTSSIVSTPSGMVYPTLLQPPYSANLTSRNQDRPACHGTKSGAQRVPGHSTARQSSGHGLAPGGRVVSKDKRTGTTVQRADGDVRRVGEGGLGDGPPRLGDGRARSGSGRGGGASWGDPQLAWSGWESRRVLSAVEQCCCRSVVRRRPRAAVRGRPGGSAAAGGCVGAGLRGVAPARA